MYQFIRSSLCAVLALTAAIGVACSSGVNEPQTSDKKLTERPLLPVGYEGKLAEWRKQQDDDLKKDDGWLSLTGLYALQDGENSVGTAETDKVILPKTAPTAFGTIELKEGKALLKLKEGVKAASDGQLFTSVDLIADQDGKPNLIEIGSVNFYLLRRENAYSIRVRDRKNPALANYKDRRWFDVNEKYRVKARFEPYEETKEISVPDVLGGEVTMKASGLLRFNIDGSEYTLEPFDLNDGLFIIFRDETSADESYAGGRYLYTGKAEGGEIILDFNYAVSPPCDFTKFATCPLPPPQNRLKIRVPAGEKRYDG